MTNALSDVSFWFDALGDLPAPDDQALPQSVDVAIVGAGFTGLWTAYYLKRAQPALRIAVLEAERVGHGASGRNGGWCMGMAWGVHGLLARAKSRARGVALARTLFDTVDEVGRVCQAENIDAHFAKGGSLGVATVPFHADSARAEVDALHAAGFDEGDYRWLPPDEARSRVGITPNHGATLFAHCAAVQPARLVLGLANAVRRQGTTIHEGVHATRITTGRVDTARGNLTATSIIRATEGYTDTLQGERRRILPLYSMVVATEPLPAALWEEIGLRERETFGDGRRVVIYGQRTLDDRMVFGGRAGYLFGSRLRGIIAASDPGVRHVERTLRTLFPMLRNVRITHGWGGLMGVPRHWRPCVQWDAATRTGWAGGYVGEGVAAANLAGRILADLVCERRTEFTALPWVNDVPRLWEPEPLRWVGAKAIQAFGDRADAVEFASGHPSRLWGSLFDRFVR